MDDNYVVLNADIYNYDVWLPFTDSIRLITELGALLEEAGFTIVNFIEHQFPVEGFTCVWLLSESHLAVHTFPMDDKSYIQLSSCSLEKKNKFEALITSNYYKTK